MSTEHSTHDEKPTIFPRAVHKAKVADKIVATSTEYDKAISEGWSKDPVAVTLTKADETATVYTVEALQAARDQGWTVQEPKAAHESTEPAKAAARK